MSVSHVCPRCGEMNCRCFLVGHSEFTPIKPPKKHTINELEKMLDLGEKPYISIDGNVESMNFKFDIGDEVQHIGFGYNAKVMRRIFTQDAESKYNSYDIAIWESNPPLEGQNVAEIHLKKGFRIE